MVSTRLILTIIPTIAVVGAMYLPALGVVPDATVLKVLESLTLVSYGYYFGGRTAEKTMGQR